MWGTARSGVVIRLASLAFTLALLGVAPALYACGSSDSSDAQPWLQETSTGEGGGQAVQSDGDGAVPGVAVGPAGGAASGPGGATMLTGWPDYIPDDIPPLDTNIRTVMEGSTSLRIFYSDLSQEQIDDYLSLLRANGFELTYVVYQDERYPDEEAAQERIEAGDFDAVNISKGDYHLDITYGGGDTTLDIQTSGFEDVYPYTPERNWPSDLAGVIPQPDGCRIEAVYAQDTGGYQIVCRPESPETVQAFVDALLAAGFAPVAPRSGARVDPGSDYPDVYGRGDVEVTVDYSPSVSTARITTWPVDVANLPAWPAALADIIPQPEGAVISMVQEWSELDYMIVCKPGAPPSAAGGGDDESASLLAAYVAQLTAAGFTDLGRSKMEGDRMVEAVLYKDPFTVNLSLTVLGEMHISTSDEAISYSD
ncbi:MAG: hypothetical protein JW990_10930 [Thermoleophilia bacterium]|nr:hypothetical protein [Thermoleophilia bacterium]